MAVEIVGGARSKTNLQAGAWRDAAKILQEWIDLCDEFADVRGEKWTMTPTQQVKMKPGVRWKCRHFDREKFIIAIRPGGNDSVWEYVVRPPSAVSLMTVGTVATMWNGWNGHDIPAAYSANRGEIEPDVVDEPEPEPEPENGDGGIMDALAAIQERAREAERLRAELAEQESRRDKLLKDADLLMREADKSDNAAKAIRERLESPDIVQAVTAIRALSGLLGLNKGGA